MSAEIIPRSGTGARGELQVIGTRLLHYEVLEKLGEGGMGVVYKARDTRLDRFVALKVLPPEKVSDTDRKCRFIQEARTASALNHPSIITIHDVGQADGLDFIAMEYVAGKTLNELIPRKGMRLSLALKYAVQIADALARAHGAGIIHRDLKPSNVMVDEHGLVKVLDFGLAKLTETSGPEAETATLRTGEGTVLGTAAYMSPEQAEGKPIDSRSDIFSFGSVLYEMLTGQRAFRGDTRASTIASILREDPKPINQVAEGLPRDAEKIVRRCLRKDPVQRFQHMDDLKVALDELKEESDSGAFDTGVNAKPILRRRFLWALSAVVVLLAITVVPLWQYFSPAKTEPLRIIPFTSLSGVELFPRLSPSGQLVAFAWNGEKQDNLDIYVKQVGGGGQIRLTSDPAEDYEPAWSPDGSEIAFVRNSEGVASIYTIPALGGTERKLIQLKAPNYPGGLAYSIGGLSWSGELLAFCDREAEQSPVSIYLLSLETREIRPLTSPRDLLGDFLPEFSPDGRSLAFVRRTGGGELSDIWVQPLSGEKATRLTFNQYANCSRPVWIASGREAVFAAGSGVSSLLRVPVAGGTPQQVAGVGEGADCPTISGNRMVYVQISGPDFDIWRMRGPAFTGKERSPAPLIRSTRSEQNPDYSPDGTKIAFESERSGFREIWICNSDGTNPTQLTSMERGNGTPRWSPDGRRIAFDSRPGEDGEIYVIDADGGKPLRLTNEKSDDLTPSWSRDGRYIYFTSNRSGSYQVWKMPAGGGAAVQITKGGGFHAIESFDHRFIYYTRPGPNYSVGSIWRCPVSGGDETPLLEREIIWANWVLRPEGIYFVPMWDKTYMIEFLDLHSGKLAPFFQEVTPHSRVYLTASPDGEWFLFADGPLPTSDLMLVENFR